MTEVVTAGLVAVDARQPLRITATLRAGLASAEVRLDGLLAWAVAQVHDLPPALRVSELRPIEIPLARAEGGRFHLCTTSVGNVDEREHVWINRRFPLAEAQEMAVEKFTRINIAAGAQKTYRLPLETRHMEDDRLTWWAIGDGAAVAELLQYVGYLGKRRAVGRGAVARWTVEGCVPWGETFPLVRDGWPMRPLPDGWPGVRPEATRAYAVLSYPYWNRAAEEVCVIPEAA